MQYILSFTILFLLGLTVGSFLNVVIFRYEKQEKVTGRSHCMYCMNQLRWFELIPLLSYLFQRGKCRKCESLLSLQYPLVELVTALLFVGVFSRNIEAFLQGGVEGVVLFLLELVLWSLFVIITVYDYRTKLIPDFFSFTLAGVALLHLFIEVDYSLNMFLGWHFLAGPILFLPFYLLWKVSDGRWLGLGDGKLALGIGWFLGLTQGVTAVLFAFWIGAGISLILLFAQKYITAKKDKKLTLKSEIPFGPFLVIGTLLIYFFEYDLFAHILF